MPELRKFERHPSDALLKYRLGSVRSKWDFSLGITHDVSSAGTCIFLLEEVREGDRVTILCDPVNAEKIAVVKWVTKVQDDIYKAGMMFE